MTREQQGCRVHVQNGWAANCRPSRWLQPPRPVEKNWKTNEEIVLRMDPRVRHLSKKKTKNYKKLPSHCSCIFTDGNSPASGGVCSALGDPGGGRSVCQPRRHSGGGVGLGDGDLLGLAGLLSAVGTEALTFQHWGTSTMETVRDADVRLALHEGPLHDEKKSLRKRKKPWSSLLWLCFTRTRWYCNSLTSLKIQFMAASNDSFYYQFIC